MLSACRTRPNLKYVLIATAVVLVFTLLAIPLIRSSEPDLDKNGTGLNPPTPKVTPPVPIPTVTPTISPTEPTVTPTALPLARNDSCYRKAFVPHEDTLDVEIGCDHGPLNFWLMWTTDRKGWKLKQYRVIDSIFSIHPNATIHILTKNMTTDDFSFYASSYKIIHHQLEYDKIFRHTPLYSWLNDTMAKPEVVNHPHFFSHLTDAMRLALLWKYGGIYMDTDAILIKKIDKVRNAIGCQGHDGNGDQDYNGAVMIFDRQHPFLYYTMHSLIRHYKSMIGAVLGLD